MKNKFQVFCAVFCGVMLGISIVYNSVGGVIVNTIGILINLWLAGFFEKE